MDVSDNFDRRFYIVCPCAVLSNNQNNTDDWITWKML